MRACAVSERKAGPTDLGHSAPGDPCSRQGWCFGLRASKSLRKTGLKIALSNVGRFFLFFPLPGDGFPSFLGHLE